MESGASSSSYLDSAGSTSDDWGTPTPPPSATHPLRTSGEQVLFPRVQLTPSYPPGPSLPRLRPASWGLPSQANEAFEGHRSTRSLSSANFRRGLDDEEEDLDLPFGGRTLPPLFVPSDPPQYGVPTMSTINSSADHSPSSEAMSTTNSLASASFPTNFPDGGYG